MLTGEQAESLFGHHPPPKVPKGYHRHLKLREMVINAECDQKLKRVQQAHQIEEVDRLNALREQRERTRVQRDELARRRDQLMRASGQCNTPSSPSSGQSLKRSRHRAEVESKYGSVAQCFLGAGDPNSKAFEATVQKIGACSRHRTACRELLNLRMQCRVALEEACGMPYAITRRAKIREVAHNESAGNALHNTSARNESLVNGRHQRVSAAAAQQQQPQQQRPRRLSESTPSFLAADQDGLYNNGSFRVTGGDGQNMQDSRPAPQLPPLPQATEIQQQELYHRRFLRRLCAPSVDTLHRSVTSAVKVRQELQELERERLYEQEDVKRVESVVEDYLRTTKKQAQERGDRKNISKDIPFVLNVNNMSSPSRRGS